MTTKPFTMVSKLAPNPTSSPKYSATIKNKAGESIEVADPKATRALVALMNQHAVIGGAACHWGGPAALAEILSSLHHIMFQANDWREAYHFINDAGHTENGIYALRANYGHDNLTFDDLKMFRSIESKLTGHGEAHLNPEGVLISNGPLGSGVPQAQGLAVADKLLGNNRITTCVLSDGGAMEGEAKEALVAIPGLCQKGKSNPFLLLVSDNDTKLSGRIGEDSYSMVPSFKSLETLGWDLIEVEDGHNLETVYQTIETAIEKLKGTAQKPIALVFKTIKGKGVEATEKAASGGHGYPLKAYDTGLTSFLEEIYGGDVPSEFSTWAREILDQTPPPATRKDPPVKKEKIQVGVANAMIDAAKNGLPVYSVSSDLAGSTGTAGFQKKFPEYTLDIGVAESNMISTAIGLSLGGYIPFVDTFAQFGITKGNLPLIMAGLSQAPLIAVFSHTGFQDAADGASHQATTYLAAVSSIPNVDVVVLSTSNEAYSYVTKAINDFADARKNGKTPRSTVFFLGRETYPQDFVPQAAYEWKKPQVVQEGTEGLLVTCGPLVGHALNAVAKANMNVTIVNQAFVNDIDTNEYKELLAKNKNRMVTFEDHQKVGGMGAQLVHALTDANLQFTCKSYGIGGKFGQSAYKADQLYAQHNIGMDQMLETIKQQFN
jgi:transketolase